MDNPLLPFEQGPVDANNNPANPANPVNNTGPNATLPDGSQATIDYNQFEGVGNGGLNGVPGDSDGPGRGAITLAGFMRYLEESLRGEPSGREYDRGVSASVSGQNHIRDAQVIQKAWDGCHAKTFLWGTSCMCAVYANMTTGRIPLSPPVPMAEYWWPVEKVEIVHTPFVSRYWDKNFVNRQVRQVIESEISQGGRWAQYAYTRSMRAMQATQAFGFGGFGDTLASGLAGVLSFNQANTEIAQFLRQNPKYAVRNPMYGGQKPNFAEFHVFPESFNNKLNRKRYFVNIRNKLSVTFDTTLPFSSLPGDRDIKIPSDPPPWWKFEPRRVSSVYNQLSPYASESPDGLELARNVVKTGELLHGRVATASRDYERDPSACAARYVGQTDDPVQNRINAEPQTARGIVAGETRKDWGDIIHGGRMPPQPTIDKLSLEDGKSMESPDPKKRRIAATSGFKPVKDGGCLGQNVGPWVPMMHWHETTAVFPAIMRLAVMKAAKSAYTMAPNQFWDFEPWPYYESKKSLGLGTNPLAAFSSPQRIVQDKVLWVQGMSSNNPQCETLHKWYNEDPYAIPFDVTKKGEEIGVAVIFRFMRTCPPGTLPLSASNCMEKIE